MNTFLGMDEALSSLIDAVPGDAPIRLAACRGVDGKWRFDAYVSIGEFAVCRPDQSTPSAAVASLKDALMNEQLAHGIRP